MKKTFVLIIFIITYFTIAVSHAGSTSEYRIKAAYIYNFAKFIKWPETTFKDEASPIIFGILGRSALTEQLDPLRDRRIRNRPIKIKYFESIEEVSKCQLLYIDIKEQGELKQIIDKLISSPTVTIADREEFAHFGGIIQFAKIRERLRFIINHNIAKKNNIRIDAQLLSLAIDVVEGE